jgi:ABC-type dipeptide/oligopeptide/nickel transport system ATPase component
MSDTPIFCEKCRTRIKHGYWKLCRDCRVNSVAKITDDPMAAAKVMMAVIEELNEHLENAYAMLAAQQEQLKEQQAILDTIKWAG